jgi:DHA2 family multidrug resistance protein
VGMPIAGRLYNHIGPRLMIGFGLSLSALSAFQMGLFTADTSYVGLIMPQVWQGIAFSFIFVSLSTAALATVPRPRMTNATALYNLVRQLGGSFGIAIIATLLENRQAFVAATLNENLNPYNPVFLERYTALANALPARGIEQSQAGQKALALLNGLMQNQAAVMAFERAFTIIGLLFVITLPLVFLLRSRKDAIPALRVD